MKDSYDLKTQDEVERNWGEGDIPSRAKEKSSEKGTDLGMVVKVCSVQCTTVCIFSGNF